MTLPHWSHRLPFCALALLTGCSESNSSDSVGTRTGAGDASADAGSEPVEGASEPDTTETPGAAGAPGDDVTFGPGPTPVTVPEPAATQEPAPAPVAETDGPNAENPLRACASAVAVGDDPRIDDFEDLNDLTLAVDNREGGWYSYDDASAGASQLLDWVSTSEPAVSGSGVLHIQGSGFFEYSGIGLGLRWTETGNEYCYYDASHYAGIEFWARGSGSIRVALQNPSVRPVAQGGTCPETASCYDSHGREVAIMPEWTLYRVGFAAVEQAGWGTAVGPFLPEELFTIEFQFPPSSVYDVELDDLAFYSADAPLPEPPEPEPPAVPDDAGVGPMDAGADVSGDAGSPAPLDAGAGSAAGDASVE